MSIFLKGEVQKTSEMKNHLEAMLDQHEPQVVRFLTRLWHTQERDIGYAELRRAILSGDLDTETIARWQQDYSRFVTDCLLPQWQIFMREAANPIRFRHDHFKLDLTAPQIVAYTAEHSAELVRNCTAQQIGAVRALIQRAAVIEDITVDQLAQMIRPTVGLYHRQAVANMNYYQTIQDNLIKQNPTMRAETVAKRAQTAALKYAERQHRYRAHMIARTELSFAHNAGAYYSVKQAQDEGVMGETRKQWVTADDVRVCGRCRALDLKTIDMDQSFPGETALLPPLHPHCRCVVNYLEIER